MLDESDRRWMRERLPWSLPVDPKYLREDEKRRMARVKRLQAQGMISVCLSQKSIGSPIMMELMLTDKGREALGQRR